MQKIGIRMISTGVEKSFIGYPACNRFETKPYLMVRFCKRMILLNAYFRDEDFFSEVVPEFLGKQCDHH